MKKTILFGKEARDKVKDGIDKVVNMVKVTLGAKGRNVMMKQSYISPHGAGLQHLPTVCTKDGVSIVRSLTLSDQIENMGSDLVKEAAEKTMSDCGDATTTTCILLQAIVEKGLVFVDDGFNPMHLKAGIDLSVDIVVDSLKKMASPVGDEVETIRRIATVSANNDTSIGDLIAHAFAQIGKDGIIDLQPSKTTRTEIKISDGVKFNRGWHSPYFITNHAKNECELIDPLILLYDKKLYQLKPMELVLSAAIKTGRPLLIVCEDADGEALAALAMNAANKKLQCCIVRCPEFGEKKREAMEDLAIIVGGHFVNEEKGIGLEQADMSVLGSAKKVVISKDETVIISPFSDEKRLNSLISNLRMDAAVAEGAEREQIENRIAKLKGSVAVLHVGAATEMAMKEKIDRCDDAIRATKAAIAEGFVPGGGTAFINAAKALSAAEIQEEYQPAKTIVFAALFEPFYQIHRNAGADFKDSAAFMANCSQSEGYNAKTGKYENLVDAGIIDPVKALRCSLQNAASAAGMILTTEGLVCDTM